MTRLLTESEMLLAGEIFSLADVVNAAAHLAAAKKEAFTAAQSELRAAEAGLQKAQEELAKFMKTKVGNGSR